MGVTGLWRLVEPAGKPVPVETLENKVLAVDISIWLHQMVKGYQDAKGAPLPNAHLLGLFQRLCKLLYFRIKPVFVFDGGFPELKKETIAKRQDHKAKYNSESERIKRELALLLSKKMAVSTLLGKQNISPSKQQTSVAKPDDLFKLPALPQREEEESDSEPEDERNSSNSSIDLHTVDLDSENFKSLPIKEKYDILLDLKDSRKQNSWGKLEELPKESDNFSDFQMQRLLKRRKVQEVLQETEQEMGDTGMSLNDLECLLNEEGIDTKINTLPTRRIASNVSSRFLLIKDINKALIDAKNKQALKDEEGSSNLQIKQSDTNEEKQKKNDEFEDDLQKAIKMSLECVDEANTSTLSKIDDSWTSCMTDTESEYSANDSEEEDGFEQPDMSCAKAYIMQYTDFTHRVIDEIVTGKKKNKSKLKGPKIDEIIDEINNEKSVIIDNVELSSSDDDCIEKDITTQNPQIEPQINVESETNPCHKSVNKQDIIDCHEKNVDSFDETQASVVFVQDRIVESISLDSSIEDTKEIEEQSREVRIKTEDTLIDNSLQVHGKCNSIEETDSSDNDFEEVSDIETKEGKTVVELTLNVDDALEDDDDIFADVFIDKKSIKSNEPINTEDKIGVESESNKLLHSSAQKVDAEKYLKRINEKPLCKKRLEVVSTNDEIKDCSISHDIQATLANESVQVCTQENTIILQENQILESIDTDKNISTNISSTEKLNKIAEEMQDQEQDLLQEKGRLDRVGRNITEQMTKEAQELLQIFGIPYIVAPMEAEAQCAFLETAKLTDGTITDDSDIWLFGGRTVYKNFFNQKKHVLQFQAERIEKSFNMSREQLVLLALLVGSDYTTGVTGVGPVTAMEILASFPFNKRQVLSEATNQGRYAQIIKGLQDFKLWVKAGKRTDNISLKKKLRNVSLTDDFPSVRVVQAYLEPNIDKNEGKFTWGELDITVLRDYTKAKFGWSQNKLDEIIKPVLKRLIERKSQRSIQDFFKRKIDFQSLENQMSKRVKAAVQRMDPDQKPEVAGNSEKEIKSGGQKVKAATKRKATTSSVRDKIAASAPKSMKSVEANVLLQQGVKVVSHVQDDAESKYEIKIHKTGNYQEIIPQREKDRRNLLENKLKEIGRAHV